MKRVKVTYKTKKGHIKEEFVRANDSVSKKGVERSVLKSIPWAHEIVSSEVVKVY
jgi:hypothetical protein